MAPPALPVDRAHRSRPVGVLPSVLLAAACAPLGSGGAVGSAARLLAPQLRGHVSTRTLRTLELKGLTVHRVGQAAYVHGAGAHLILAVWDRGDPVPPFAARLGRASDGYRRRSARVARETRHLELARIRGRFAGRLPWWRVPGVRAYSFEPEPGTWLERVQTRAAERNRAVRVAAGLEWADGRGGAL